MQAASRLPQSRLPMPGSRLRPPSQVKMPTPPTENPVTVANTTTTTKRLRSPESVVPIKKARLDSHVTKPRKPSTNGIKKALVTRSNSASNIGAKKVVVKAAPIKQNAPGRPANFSRPGGTTTNRRLLATKNTIDSAPATKPTAGLKTKRQPWDLKGRLEDLEKIYNESKVGKQQLANNLAENSTQLESVTVVNTQLQNNVHRLKETLEQVQASLQSTQKNYDDDMRIRNREIEDLKFKLMSVERQRDSLTGELTAAQKQTAGLQATVAQLTSAQAGISAELTVTKINLEHSLSEVRCLKAELVKEKEIIEDQNQCLMENETERRQLHNLVQELKGNIRVYCRVRPLLPEEHTKSEGEITHINFPDKDSKVLEIDTLNHSSLNESMVNTRKGSSQQPHEFNFDRVFNTTTTQQDVFKEISQLVQSALDGYNVSIFAYGQTGSGKTYTMEGVNSSRNDEEGVIPRSVRQIFETTTKLEEKGWKYQFEASFLEIYNETIRDLLGDGKEAKKHDIKMTGADGSSDVTVTNLIYVPVTSSSKVHKLLAKASENRAVAETKSNERSSRSHSVFRLKITGANETTSEACQGTLNLIDLAGSERIKDSKSEGARLKEAQAINLSLSHLGNVIMALANKESHIPYRNSKLTYLLQNSLGGNSKTLMFVNISPKESNIHESLCSLRFATKVNQCHIGTATKKVR